LNLDDRIETVTKIVPRWPAPGRPGLSHRLADRRGGAVPRVREPAADAGAAGLRGLGVQLRHIDLGGGLGIAYAGGEPTLDVAAFGAALTAAARELELELVLEPGSLLRRQRRRAADPRDRPQARRGAQLRDRRRGDE
jgi:hypothetical protein